MEDEPMETTQVVARITDTVGYLRIEVAPAGEDREWISCAELISTPARLAALATAAGPQLGTDELDVALSLFVQGYAFRVAAVAVGAWLLEDVVVDLEPARMEVALAKGRPNAVRLTDPALVGTGEPGVDALLGALVDGHLASVVDSAHEAGRVGRALLWGDVGASVAAAFAAFVDPMADRRLEVRRQLEELVAARPELAQSGEVVPVGERWLWQRNACCLWFKTASAYRCQDCSLATEDERLLRIESLRQEQASEA